MENSFEESVGNLEQIIVQSKKWVLVTHVHPDGDAVGSALGFKHFLESLGKEVTVVLPDRAPENLSFLPGYGELVNAEDATELSKARFLTADSIAFLDFNKASRCGEVEAWIQHSSAKKVMIDHHPYPDFDDVLQISQPSVSSTCELLTRIIITMGYWKDVTLDAASCLYTGILTDTGGFSHNSSDPGLYRMVADLLEKGIDKDEIHNEVLHQQSASRMQLMGYCLSSKLMLLEEHHTAIISLTKEELEQYNFKKGDTEGFVNLPLSIKGIQLSILVMDREGETRMSFRSKGDFPANKVASDHFNGGGHRNAAGGRSDASVEQTVDKILQVLPDYASFF